MINFITYYKEDGLIQSKSSVPYDSDVFTTKEGHDVLILTGLDDEVQDDTHYVDLKSLEVKRKIENPAYLSEDKILDIPEPSLIHITGPRMAEIYVEDGFLELEADISGLYTVHIFPSNPWYLTKVITVNLV